MRFQIQKLKDCEQNCTRSEEGIIAPGRWFIVWSEVEVHGREAEQDEVMETVLEDIRQGHGVI